MADARGMTSATSAATSSAAAREILRYANHEVIMELLRQDVDEDDVESVDRRAKEIELKLADVERRSIDEHATECENLLELGREVEACEAILGAMESTLGTFQEDLGKISIEIRDLQRASEDLRVKHANRARAERVLGEIIESLTVEPELINALFKSDAGDEEFVQGVSKLGGKLDALKSMRSKESITSASLPALNEFAPALEKLRIKAVDRSWAFLYGEFAALKKPRTNVQLMQENSLAKYAPLIDFLRKNGPEVYWEVKSVYANTMGTILKTSVASYLESLKTITKSPRLKVALASKTRASASSSPVGDASSSAASVFAGMFSGMSLSPMRSDVKCAQESDENNLFVLGDRARTILAAESEPPFVVHRQSDKVAQQAQEFDAIFRSAHRLLIDTATFEFAFCDVFWKGERELFDTVFAGPLVAYNDFVAQILSRFSHDAVGLLVAIRVNNAHRRVMMNRRMPALDAYIDNLNMTLWPRFKQACDVHTKSLEDLRDSFEPSPEAPSFIVKRYASFVLALTTIAHTKLGGDEADVTSQVDSLLDHMRQVFFECVSSKLCASLKATPRLRSAYLVKSYDFVCSTLSSLANLNEDVDEHVELPTRSTACTELATLQFFETALADESKAFVDHALVDRFGSIVTLKTRLESADGADEASVRESLGKFHREWKQGMEAMYADCSSCYGSTQGDWRPKDLFRRAQSELVQAYGALVGDGDDVGAVSRKLGQAFRESVNDIVVTKPTFALEFNRLTA